MLSYMFKVALFCQDGFPLWKKVVAGMTAGGLGQLVASPTDLIKTQIQMEGRRRLQGKPPRVHGMTDAFKKIVAANGLAGKEQFQRLGQFASKVPG